MSCYESRRGDGDRREQAEHPAGRVDSEAQRRVEWEGQAEVPQERQHGSAKESRGSLALVETSTTPRSDARTSVISVMRPADRWSRGPRVHETSEVRCM